MSRRALPLDSVWHDEDEYVTSLLIFVTKSDFFQNLCGGIHILDFLTREPDLYTTILPEDWRAWFEQVSVHDVLDLLLRGDLGSPGRSPSESSGISRTWRGAPSPPESLVEYVGTIRRLCLLRDFKPVSSDIKPIPRHIAAGMKPKKIHEVTNFAAYVDQLSSEISSTTGVEIDRMVDFGSGQNYLGRTLASPPYNRHVIAIEQKHHNIAGAREKDVHAKLTKKQKIMRNKKEYKRLLELAGAKLKEGEPACSCGLEERGRAVTQVHGYTQDMESEPGKGSMTYVEHEIADGELEDILYPTLGVELSPSSSNSSQSGHPSSLQASDSEKSPASKGGLRCNEKTKPGLMVVSLHSCGNLVHHGLRSLILNPSVRAVAMIGCCYNLMTERLGPATYKLPTLRPYHPRLEATSSAYDPHGFPMSKTLENFGHEHGRGVRLNITARMMAVQAPHNWGSEDSEAFFKRHYYRALLQRILWDRGVVKQSSDPESIVGGSLPGKDTAGTPLIVGSLRKSCFESFQAYVRGAIAKLAEDPVDGPMIQDRTSDLTNDVIDQYEADWSYAKKNLSVIWSLMAFSAGAVESTIVVDRWLFLREQECINDCWVEPVFDYGESPRNLAVVGLKRKL